MNNTASDGEQSNKKSEQMIILSQVSKQLNLWKLKLKGQMHNKMKSKQKQATCPKN